MLMLNAMLSMSMSMSKPRVEAEDEDKVDVDVVADLCSSVRCCVGAVVLLKVIFYFGSSNKKEIYL